MNCAIKWTLALSCLAAAASGVVREAKVRTALHLQCRDGQLIIVESALLLAGRQQQQQQQLASSTASAEASAAAWNGSLSQPATVGGAATSSSTTSAAVENAVELQCQRPYLQRDEDYRMLVRRCSGYRSCSGIVKPNNLTMQPCGRQFGSDPGDYLEVNYICIDPSDVSDICDNVTKTLFRGYIRSPGYPETVAALSSRVGSAGHLRCSCMLAAQNYASIELFMQDVSFYSSAAWKLELAPAQGRPIVRLHQTCFGNQTGSAAESAAGSSGCTNRQLSTSYSRLNVTFTLMSKRDETVGEQSLPLDMGRFLLSYSARELGRIVSTCQLLEGSNGSTNDERPATFTSVASSSSAAASSGGFGQLPALDWTTAAAEAADQEQVSVDEESDSGLASGVVGALVPVSLLTIALAVVGARIAWIYQRRKHWRNRSWSFLPSVCRRCCVQRSMRLSFAPIVGRAFDGVVYAMPGGAGTSSKGCTLHTYDEAARASCPADCDDDHYDTIPGHHHYQDVEFGCRHYETLPDGICNVASKGTSYAHDAGGKSSHEAGGATVSLVALVTQVPSSCSSSSSSSSASSSESSHPPIVGASTSTLYEVLGDCSAGAASPLPAHSDSCSVSVRSLGIDFSDVVAESLKRMSTPMFHSAMPLGTIVPGVDTDRATQAQCEDYLSPTCSHRDGSCCHAAAAKTAAVARVGSRHLPPLPDAAAVDESTREGDHC